LDINRTFDYRENCCTNEILSSVKWKKKSSNKTIRNGVIEINQKIFEFNQIFEDNEIEFDACLTLISSLVGVKYDKWRKQLKKNKRSRKYDSEDDHND
jgi:hypothetical protein